MVFNEPIFDSKNNLMKYIAFTVGLFIVVVLLGALIIGNIEGWNFLDSFYFTMMTSTTIGFGDIAPVTSEGKLFVSFYSILGVGMFLYIFALLTATNGNKSIENRVDQLELLFIDKAVKIQNGKINK